MKPGEMGDLADGIACVNVVTDDGEVIELMEP